MEKTWVSPSLYASLCKYKYLNLKEPQTKAQSWGTLAHDVMSKNIFNAELEDPRVVKLSYEDQLRMFKYHRNLRNHLFPRLDSDPKRLYREGCGLEKMVPGTWKERHNTLLCHVEFDKFGIRFSPDILSFKDKRITIIDLKTGKTEYGPEQLEAMAAALNRVYPNRRIKEIKGWYFYLESGKLDDSFVFNDFEEIESKIGEIADMCKDHSKAPTTKNKYCWNCKMSRNCPTYKPEIIVKDGVGKGGFIFSSLNPGNN